jgi:hypothetical protein
LIRHIAADGHSAGRFPAVVRRSTDTDAKECGSHEAANAQRDETPQ